MLNVMKTTSVDQYNDYLRRCSFYLGERDFDTFLKAELKALMDELYKTKRFKDRVTS